MTTEKTKPSWTELSYIHKWQLINQNTTGTNKGLGHVRLTFEEVHYYEVREVKSLPVSVLPLDTPLDKATDDPYWY